MGKNEESNPEQEPGHNPKPLLRTGEILGIALMLHLFFRFPHALQEGFSSLAVPSLETFLVVAVLLLVARLRPPLMALMPLAAASEFLLIFSLADSLVELNFSRPLSLLTDVGYLPDLFRLLRDTLPLPLFLGGLILLAVILAAMFWALTLLFTRFCKAVDGLVPRRTGRVFTLGAMALMMIGLQLFAAPGLYASSAFPRLATETARLMGARRYEQERQDEYQRLAQEEPAAKVVALDLLDKRDVFLFVVESYGYTLYDEKAHFAMAEPYLKRFEARLHEAGYSIASNFLSSPAFGGNSWLADSTLASGTWVGDQVAYDALLKSDISPMAQRFNEAGYHTVISMPGTTQDWPEGDYFRFATKYYYRDFGYRGPSFRWAPMPDQYAMSVVHSKEVVQATDPLFVQFVMVSGHYPFSLLPRRLEDWSELGDGSVFADQSNRRSIPIPAGAATAGAAGYVAAMEYQLDVLSDYVARFLSKRRALVIVVGDHQPYSGISGKGKPRSVPIHVLSRDSAVLRPFLDRGYTPGWVPAQALPHAGLDTVLPALLEDFTSASRAAP